VGGMTLHELNILEIYYLTVINWSLYIATEEFDRYEAGFKTYVATVLP
jgi:hypothetical protein